MTLGTKRLSTHRAANFQPARFRRMLVPLDGSAFAERALPLAADIARRTGAELQIVHVDSTFGLAHTRDRLVQDDIVCRDGDELKRHKRAYVERIAGTASARIHRTGHSNRFEQSERDGGVE